MLGEIMQKRFRFYSVLVTFDDMFRTLRFDFFLVRMIGVLASEESGTGGLAEIDADMFNRCVGDRLIDSDGI